MTKSEYKPLMSQDEIEKRRSWQEEVYKNLSKTKKKETVRVLGTEFVILPGMFAPRWMDSSLLAEVIKENILKDQSVLDLGTGSGIQGIFAAQQGARVIAVDINPESLKCAKENALKHNIQNLIKYRESDLFTNITEKFDAILFNPPFRWFKPRDVLERGELDENYKTLSKFFKQAKDYLNPNGLILLVFSDSGDIKYLEQLINTNGYNFKILKSQKAETGWSYFVYEIKHST